MKIGEHRLSLAYQRVFRFDRFLYLYYQIGFAIDVLDSWQNLGSYGLIFRIGKATALASSMLYEYLMSATYQLGDT